MPEFDVLAFGSRLNPSVKEFADLDLVIMTMQPLSIRRYRRLVEAFSESDLPIKVGLVDWATTDQNFRAIIRQKTEMVQKGAKKQAVRMGE